MVKIFPLFSLQSTCEAAITSLPNKLNSHHINPPLKHTNQFSNKHIQPHKFSKLKIFIRARSAPKMLNKTQKHPSHTTYPCTSVYFRILPKVYG
jgi:hypothetical protein